jgi:hypothetical protein
MRKGNNPIAKLAIRMKASKAERPLYTPFDETTSGGKHLPVV